MPSATFYRLAPEKQERLLTAATREFSRRPFSEASINQIIKDAGIPRGSFYMYFADKEDLFRYVMEGYVDQLLLVVRESILRCGGDLFEGMLGLYDYVQSRRQEQQVGQMGAVTTIIACNSGLQQNMLLGLFTRQRVLDALGDVVAVDRLDLRCSEDLENILALVLSVTGPLLLRGAAEGEDASGRERLAALLELCRRGMARDKGNAADKEKGE